MFAVDKTFATQGWKGCNVKDRGLLYSLGGYRGALHDYRDSTGWYDSPYKKLVDVHEMEPVKFEACYENRANMSRPSHVRTEALTETFDSVLMR